MKCWAYKQFRLLKISISVVKTHKKVLWLICFLLIINSCIMLTIKLNLFEISNKLVNISIITFCIAGMVILVYYI